MTPVRRQLGSPLEDEADKVKTKIASSLSDPHHGALVRRPVSRSIPYALYVF